MNGKDVELEILSRNLGKAVDETVKSQIDLLSNHIVKSVKNKEERRSRYLLPLKYLLCYAQNSGLQDILKMESEQEKDFVSFLKSQTRKSDINATGFISFVSVKSDALDG